MPYDPDVLMIICQSFICVHSNLIDSIKIKFNESFDSSFYTYFEACVELIQDIEQSEDLRSVYNILLAHINSIRIP
jgi:hypothetical protein